MGNVAVFERELPQASLGQRWLESAPLFAQPFGSRKSAAFLGLSNADWPSGKCLHGRVWVALRGHQNHFVSCPDPLLFYEVFVRIPDSTRPFSRGSSWGWRGH